MKKKKVLCKEKRAKKGKTKMSKTQINFKKYKKKKKRCNY